MMYLLLCVCVCASYAQMTGQWYETKRGPKGPKQGLAQRFAAGVGAIHAGISAQSAASVVTLGHPHLMPGDAERLREVLWTGPLGMVLKLFLATISVLSALLVCGELVGVRQHRGRKRNSKGAKPGGGGARARRPSEVTPQSPVKGLLRRLSSGGAAAAAPAESEPADGEDPHLL